MICGLKTNFTSQYLRSETKSQHAFGPFFAIIRAVMDEIEKFFRELFRINDNNYDAKYEIPRINIKWFVAKKRIF